MTADERQKIGKDLAGLEREVAALTRKLGDEAFLAKAPPAVIEKNRKQLAELEERRSRLAGNLGAAKG
jgi:valyl-tRNA synthetase